jgi:uncharacterized membrane protein YeaQ/YmgE (transglycosylase-associated protein family)
MPDYDEILAWIAIGGLAGWMAGLIVEGYGFGLLGNVIVGVVGAGLAGCAVNLLGLSISSKIGAFVAASTGAVVLLIFIEFLRRLR